MATSTMRPRIFITVFIFLRVGTAIGQTLDYSQKFHTHQQVCNSFGTSEYDYLIKLREDSTITFIVYSTDYETQYKTVIKQIYEGHYSIHSDTIIAVFTTYNSFTKKKGDKSKLFSTKQDQLGKINQPFLNQLILFKLTKEDIEPLNSYIIPKMAKSSAVNYSWLNTKFDFWQNKEFTDREIFGLNPPPAVLR